MLQLVSYGPWCDMSQEILILITCFRESYEKNSQHKRQIGRCNCILSKNNIKLQPVTPLMPLEALLIPVNLTDSDSDGINGGTGCNFMFFNLKFRIKRTKV